MSRIEVSLVNEDPDVSSRVAALRVHSKKVISPTRALCLTQDPNSEARVLGSQSLTGINEVPRELDKAMLEDIDGDRDKQEAFYRNIRRRFVDINVNDNITAFIFTYNNKPDKNERNRQPGSAETEYLCGLLNHPLNDLWIPPIVPELSGRAYIPYLQDFYKEAESYPKAAVAGLIPRLASIEIRQLANFYIQLGLNYFVMDFAGKNPLDVGNINPVTQMVAKIERETGTYCFLHGINVPLTKSRWNRPVVPAKDILVFGMGFDCFGTSHIRPRWPDEIADKINSSMRPFRLFCRRDYAYYRGDTHGLRLMVEEESQPLISFDDVAGETTGRKIGVMEKLFNVERHGLEASSIRQTILRGESVGGYLQSKSKLPPHYLEKVFGVRRQTSLNGKEFS